MNYTETVDWLYNQLPVYQRDGFIKYKLDLNSIKSVCNFLQNPQDNFKSIHVAGTNGKGSTSHMLASIFHEGGYKVGLYTSPHLIDFRERIKLNGKKIPESNVVDFVKKYQDYFKKNKISFFEMTVAMAFYYFSKSKVDIAIIETGLGGRLDATNIINPIISIITNVGLDHQEFLGEDIKQIAREKAGIIKSFKPVVISEYQSSIHKIFIDKANEKNSDIYLANDIDVSDFSTDLQGSFQKKNIKGVIKSLSIMDDLSISTKDIKKGLLNVINNTGLRGRWEIINQSPKTILDVGHNLEAFKETIKAFDEISFGELRIVIGFVKGKNFEKILRSLPKDAYYYFCQPDINRALKVEEIFNYSKKIGIKGKSFLNVKSAYQCCCDESRKEDLIFIGGSNFIVSDIIEVV